MPISLVQRITDAYEAGFGTGMDGKDTYTNPYQVGTVECEAWDIGYTEGKKRKAEIEKNKITLLDRYKVLTFEEQVQFQSKFVTTVLENLTIDRALEVCDTLNELVPDEHVLIHRASKSKVS